MFGVSGSLPIGRLPVAGAAGFELLCSPRTHKAALYDYAAVSVPIGQTSSRSIQGTAGLVYRCPDSKSYTEYFTTITVPFASLPQSVQGAINRKATYIAFSAFMGTGGGSAINTAFMLGIPTQGILNKTSISIFWSPDQGGACGFSFSNTLLANTSTSRASYSFADYGEIAPMGDNGAENVPF